MKIIVTTLCLFLLQSLSSSSTVLPATALTPMEAINAAGDFVGMTSARKNWPVWRDFYQKPVKPVNLEERQAIFDNSIELKAETGISNSMLTGLATGIFLLASLIVGVLFINALLRIRMARQTEALSAANARLSELNVELERRVTDRTGELEKAYSDLNASQAKMLQSEKMVALGQMIAGIANEINTPLDYAHRNVMILRDFVARVKNIEKIFNDWQILISDGNSSEDDISKKFLEVETAFAELKENDEIEDCDELATDTIFGLDQISEITQNLKHFSRLDQAETVDVNLNDNIDRTLKLAKNLLKDHIKVALSLAQIPMIKCNPSKINQVLLNVITNACQAIDVSGKEQGKLTIGTDYDDDLVNITVEDNGTGIASEVGKKIFDPFYTTKDIHQGTGLGLSISYDIIVKQHNGKICVRTREGVGTTITISLRTENDADQVPEAVSISQNGVSIR